MGGCLSLGIAGSRSRRRQRNDRYSLNRARRSIGEIHTQPLKPVKPKWKSDIPINEGQLKSKRDEFWETAPAFEGRREIWDALKAASAALEGGDHSLAQAIIDGANISLPNGILTDCYDELGNRYQLPVYVLSSPVNLIDEMSGDSENVNDLLELQPGGKEYLVGIRLSTGKELKLKVNSGESIYRLKRRIFELEGVDPSKQRFLFCGHLLVDRDRLKSIKIPKGFLLQVMIVEPSATRMETWVSEKFLGDSKEISAPETVLNETLNTLPPSCIDGNIAQGTCEVPSADAVTILTETRLSDTLVQQKVENGSSVKDSGDVVESIEMKNL